MDIPIKMDEGLKEISAAHEGEWFDLRSAEDVVMLPGEYHEINLGVAMALPDGYEAIIAPRSHTFEKWGIIMTSGIGVIDNLHRGDGDVWKFPAFAFKVARIHKNDRICQFRIQKAQPEVNLVRVNSLGYPDRGGFGSTGDK